MYERQFGRIPSPRPFGRLLAVGLAVLLLGVPGCGGDAADQADAGGDTAAAAVAPDSGIPPGITGGQQTSSAIQQYRRLDQRLQQIRQQALQDSGLSAEQTRLRETLVSAMQEDAQTAVRMERFDSLRQALQTAQREGDTAKMRELIPALQRLQMQLQQAQQAVLQRDEIAVRVDSFQLHLEQEMEEVNPRASELRARQDSLAEEIRSRRPPPASGSRRGADTATDTTRRR